MSVQHYQKECPGCHKRFKTNRARKKHIRGHVYYESVNVKDDKGRVVGRDRKEVVIKACPLIPDNQREEFANIYRLVPAEVITIP